MSPGRHHWSLGSLLLLLAGGNLGVFIEIHQDSVNGTVGQSVLLPVSYRFNNASQFPLAILWKLSGHSNPIISCTLQSCSLGAEGVPSNCSAKCAQSPTYYGHVEFVAENGSLLLRDLRLNDSGIYCIIFRTSHQTRRVTLTVHERRFTPRHPGNPSCPALPAPWRHEGFLCSRLFLAGPTEPNHDHYYAIGICSSFSLLLLLLLLFCCLQHRGAAWWQKRRIIKQQQISGVEEAHMESTTIYATVGDSFEQASPRLGPEVMYTTITSPRPRRWDP